MLPIQLDPTAMVNMIASRHAAKDRDGTRRAASMFQGWLLHGGAIPPVPVALHYLKTTDEYLNWTARMLIWAGPDPAIISLKIVKNK